MEGREATLVELWKIMKIQPNSILRFTVAPSNSVPLSINWESIANKKLKDFGLDFWLMTAQMLFTVG